MIFNRKAGNLVEKGPQPPEKEKNAYIKPKKQELLLFPINSCNKLSDKPNDLIILTMYDR